MTSIEATLRPLIGQHIWSVRRTHGSMMLMEFGQPRLSIGKAFRDTQAGDLGAPMRRPVFAMGEWSLLVGDCLWRLEIGTGLLTNEDTDSKRYDLFLRTLSGQVLVSAQAGATAFATELRFDLGARLVLAPADRPDLTPADEQWLLRYPDGAHVSHANDGTLVFSAPGE